MGNAEWGSWNAEFGMKRAKDKRTEDRGRMMDDGNREGRLKGIEQGVKNIGQRGSIGWKMN